MSPDGLVLIFGAKAASGDDDLWSSQRVSITAPFSAPTQLKKLNSSSTEMAPSLAPMTPSGGKTRTELFYVSDRSGTRLVYLAVCIH